MKYRPVVCAVLPALVLPALAVLPAAAQQAGTDRAAPSPMRGAGMIRMADANGDGVVTRAEYMAAVDARFARMDVNGDGVLSADEMPMRGRWHGGGADAPPPPPPAEMSGGATGTPPAPPAMPDGARPAQTRDQYRAAAMRRFDRLDTNGDGRIDQTELAAAAPGMGPPMGAGRPMRGGMAGSPPPPPPSGE